MFNFTSHCLNCTAYNFNQGGGIASNGGLYEKGELTRLRIETRKYLASGCLTENEVKRWADEILKDCNINPKIWRGELDYSFLGLENDKLLFLENDSNETLHYKNHTNLSDKDHYTAYLNNRIKNNPNWDHLAFEKSLANTLLCY